MNLTLKEIIKELEEIVSNWNGEDEGKAEDNFQSATFGLSCIYDLEHILEELNIK